MGILLFGTKCQEPPFREWWNVAVIRHFRWFLSMLRNFSYSKAELAFQPPIRNWWKISDILPQFVWEK